VTWREEIGNAEMSMLPRRDRTRFRCVLRPSLAYRKSRVASRLQFFTDASAAIHKVIAVLLSFITKKKKKECSQEKHANGTAESGVFLLPSSRNYRFFHLSRMHSNMLKLSRSKFIAVATAKLEI